MNSFQTHMVSALDRFRWQGEPLRLTGCSIAGNLGFSILSTQIQIGNAYFSHEFTSELSIEENLRQLEAALAEHGTFRKRSA